MKTHTRFIAKLRSRDKKTLNELVKHSESFRVRNRAKAILLSAQGKNVTEITEFFQVSHNTVYAWFDRWENDRFEGIADQPRSGAPSQLSDSEKEIVLELLKKHPHSPKLVLAEVSSRLGKTISEWILRQIAIAAGMSWKRMRKSLKSKQNKKKFRDAKREINKLASQHQSGKIDLVFFDEAGFSLTPTVPYGWQMIGEWIEIPSSRSAQINVMGVLNYDSELRCCVVEGSINSDCVVGYFDQLSEAITKKTVVVIDNAPVHTSNHFQSQLDGWRKKDLHFYFLPPYSPELNLIEILWRMIKHHWLPLSVYESYQNLLGGLCDVLRKVGTEYNVNFKCHNKEP